jgi:ABC-type bacteriocin/lantibiotic exporter with double-glycine peptidase domain
MAAATIVGSHALLPEPPASDGLLLGFIRLCRQLERPVTEAELRASVTLPEAGADLACLAKLATRCGFGLKSPRMSARELSRLPTPFLILGRQPGQAWLVRNRKRDELTLVDPVGGATTPCTIKVAAGFGDRLVRLMAAAPAGRGFWRSAPMRDVRAVLWQIGLASVVINLLALATPLFMMTVYNKVINHAALQTLDVLAIGMVTLVAFELALRALRGWVTAHTGARLETAIGSDLVHHLLQLPYRFYETNPSASVMERVRQVDQLRQFLTGHLPLLIVDLAFVGLFLSALLVIAPTLGLVTAAAIPAFVLLSVLAQRRQELHQRASFRAVGAKSAALSEAVGQALTVKLLGLEADMKRRFEHHLLRSAWTGLQSGRVAHLANSLGQALQHLTALVLVYLGARLIVVGDMTVGALVAASILSARTLAPMRQLALAWHQFQQTREAIGRLDELLAERGEASGRLAGAELAVKGRLRVEELTFRYPGAATPALDGVSFEVAPGSMLGIAGAPGSGKSTLVRLLLSVEVPESGRVLLDDHDLSALSPVSYRAQIGVVPQEIHLFAGTIAENIALGAADRTLARVVAAARFVGADEFIRRLPQGYETVLGERGNGLSLGQRQLLAVARAIVRNPRMLVLDEATSALDTGAEAHGPSSWSPIGRPCSKPATACSFWSAAASPMSAVRQRCWR